MTDTTTQPLVMLVYPGMTLQDLVGPLQVWSAVPGAQIQFVWKEPGPIPTDTQLTVMATHSYADAAKDPAILFAPGGGMPTLELLEDQETLAFLADRGARAGWVTSVCTGALLLAAAGLLKGYRATSHWYSRDFLSLFGATPTHERWVIDRNRATGGGVTAGIDFGLALLAQIAGDDMAKVVQLGIEYAPAPPFKSGTPEEADPATVDLITSMYMNRDAETLIKQAASRMAD